MTSRTGRPIVIADYDPAWRERFRRERELIYRACGRDAFVRIEHMGSTAVPGLAAKPIVDMMPGLRSLDDAAALIPRFQSLGFEYVPEYEHDIPGIGPGMPFRRYFRKDEDGERAFHVHMVEAGNDFWREHLMFRNYLRWTSSACDEYAALKRRLAETFNREMLAKGVDVNVGYTDHKTELIERIKAQARERASRSTPVRIVGYDERWPAIFARERERIVVACGDALAGVEHVGSTSVPGLAAKDKVDIAVALHDFASLGTVRRALAQLGYALDDRDEPQPEWRVFMRVGGDAKVNLHAVPSGGERWRRWLLFRDYLRTHPDRAAAYAALKREMAAEFGRDRIGYVEAKGEFIEETLELAAAAARG